MTPAFALLMTITAFCSCSTADARRRDLTLTKGALYQRPLSQRAARWLTSENALARASNCLAL